MKKHKTLMLIAAVLAIFIFSITIFMQKTQPKQEGFELYDGTMVTEDDLSMGVGYEFDDYDIIKGFQVEYQSGYDGRMTELRINDKSMTFGDVVEKYKDTLPEGQNIAQDEYIEILGFSAVCVTDESMSYETVETFTRGDVYLEEAESFDIIYTLSDVTINGFKTSDFDRMIDTLGRPRFAALAFDTETDELMSVDYFWDMGNDRFLTILESGVIRIQSSEFLRHSRPMFEPYLT